MTGRDGARNAIRTGLLLAAVGLLAIGGPGARPASAQGSSFPPPRLGLRLHSMTPELRTFFGVPGDRGVLVVAVEPGEPAQRAGIEVGDVVVAVDGDPVSEPFDLVYVAARAPANEPLRFQIARRGERVEIPVVPRGEPWVPFDEKRLEELRERMRRGLEQGRRELRERLDDLERRLEELERRLEEEPPAGAERTSGARPGR